MKKKMLIAGMLGMSVLGLAACEESYINYEGEKMRMSEVEERIADKLEVENPDEDIDVDIYEESDD
jgi:ABC-type glycerol-3-phosphate transport system substrate-binding protein